MKPLLGFTLAAATIGAGAWFIFKGGHLGPLAGSRRRTLRGAHEITDLHLFIDNDGDLYRQQKKPIELNLERKLKKGIFDKTKAEKLWGYLVTNGAKKYAKDFGDDGVPWHKLFTTADRKAVAKALNESFMDEHNVRA